MNAEKLLFEIYAEYLRRIKNGFSKQQARDFTDKSKWPNSEWDIPEYQNFMIGLNRAGMIKRYIRGTFVLENAAISFVESRQ